MQNHAHKIYDAQKIVPHLRAQRNMSRIRRRRQYASLVVIIITLVLQFFTTLQIRSAIPSQGATSDVIYGGITSKEELLLAYDNRDSPFSALASSLDIDRKAITTLDYTPRWSAKKMQSLPIVVWSMSPNYLPFESLQKTERGSIATIKDPSSRYLFYGTAVESTLFYALDTQPVYRGVTRQGTPFTILANSGNIITNWSTAQNVNFCYRSPDPESVLNCPNSNRYITRMFIDNISYKTDGHFIKNRPGDKLRYTLSIENASNEPLILQPRLLIDDVLEYSDAISVEDGNIELQYKSIQWPVAKIPAAQKRSFSFVTTLKKDVPTTRQNETNAQSNDCELSVYYGVADSVAIICPPPKVIERSINSSLPYDSTLIGTWVLLLGVSLLTIRNDIVIRKLNQEIAKHIEGNTP